MMREVSKSAALVNAQSVMASAILFGHGDTVTLSCNGSAIVLTIVYDSAWFVYEREIEWLSDRFMAGCKHWFVDDSEVNTFAIFVSWEFNPNLK